MLDVVNAYISSPLGWLKISATDEYLCEVNFMSEDYEAPKDPAADIEHPILSQCETELKEYFEGKRTVFTLPLQQRGTAFQQSVWNELLRISYGNTISYLELAKRLGNEKVIRAAASSNGRNQIAIIVPCHRVIGSNSQMIGYAAGISRKKWLLQHEASFSRRPQTLF